MPKDNLEKNLSELLDLSKKLREANKDLRNKKLFLPALFGVVVFLFLFFYFFIN